MDRVAVALQKPFELGDDRMRSRRHGVEPTACLKDVLEKLHDMMASEAEQLTPSNWKKSKINTH
ncbi:hypothetical protein [Pelagicoccus sp. SDUM812002]|uniref:hypothetical protein n=1 Tax=Pelagicoccus sp. SDUM812002 TaxID=3041266 RepID=UPI00280E1F9D|nr:hypothetical protein [Pelagicoccus sp. SDUM812002]MDQ8187793.1 hypothetical protein [Pelagicoccus sp. SDUM812002]